MNPNFHTMAPEQSNRGELATEFLNRMIHHVPEEVTAKHGVNSLFFGKALLRAIYGPREPNFKLYEKTFEARLIIATARDGFFGYDPNLKLKIYLWQR